MAPGIIEWVAGQPYPAKSIAEHRGSALGALHREVNHLAIFTNQATLTYTGGTVNSNVVTGEIRDVVSVSKTAVTDSYRPGGSSVYVVSIVNSGDMPVADVAVTDDLGGYEFEGETVYPLSYVEGSLVYLVNGSVEPAPTAEAGAPLVISDIEVPAQANVVLIYETLVTAYAPLGADAEITNTVTVTGPCISAALTASATVPMEMDPLLSITKSLDPEVVSGCDQLTYTFTVQNSGSQAGEDAAIVVSDTFDPILTDIAVTLNGEELPTSDYSYDEITGVFATNSGRITVPAAAFTQNEDGTWTTEPGIAVLRVTGTI